MYSNTKPKKKYNIPTESQMSTVNELIFMFVDNTIRSTGPTNYT